MEKIASFTIDHNKLQKGMYISRIDGDIVTYDIRMKKPNNNDFLSTGQMHTFEHLFATYARNTEFKDNVIYVGPMGCRTGFYFLVRNKIRWYKTASIINLPGQRRIQYIHSDCEYSQKAACALLSVKE